MQKSDFYYDLPPELIAQTPIEPRDASRLLCLGRQDGQIAHHNFYDLPKLLRAGDLLVLNNTKVLPARLIGARQPSGGVCELLLLRQTATDTWECLARPGKRLKPDSKVVFGDGTLVAEILNTLPNGSKIAKFSYDTDTIYEKLEQFGQMPLPPYIREKLADGNRYQTVYARHPGSAAAPTAGLHFTQPLFSQLSEKGIGMAEITLHVGLGTFRPVQEDEIEDHPMHAEWYTVDKAAAEAINNTKRHGGRVIAVGTTSCRTLEAVAQAHGSIVPASGETDIFIYPGYSFKTVDGLLTNFHLPESTLIMLVAAFCGREVILNAYHTAVAEQYRFFSFGDAMLII
ncbi:MAG: tRNA preQ1(34) S-adenosylmethionine ribosyltransferase-isomerase QueA [Ruminococcaceae bacterium]|nr:tRNA preQ1(34) S-adenosylmethionine ribosyltransferase-isomerase QueA [Oscillospiraceae bacterium]